MLRILGASALAFALCACRALPTTRAPSGPGASASAPTPAPAPAFVCVHSERLMQRDTLYFGRSRRDGGAVSDAQWRTFVDDVIVPRFPDGFTVLAAEGHWRGGDGAIVTEPSQAVVVLHMGDPAAQRAIEEIVAQYKREFAQESVLRERTPTCAKF